ncbi:redoxin family protein, partial [Roseibium sp.]
MRRRDVLAGVLALAASPASARPPIPNHGTPRDLLSPPFVDGDGRDLTLADFEGRVVLLNIWATWCPP